MQGRNPLEVGINRGSVLTCQQIPWVVRATSCRAVGPCQVWCIPQTRTSVRPLRSHWGTRSAKSKCARL